MDKINKLMGSNMDIDFSNSDFGNSACPWNVSENTDKHKCAVKNTSICPYFCGVQFLDSVLCSYPYENLCVLSRDQIDRDLEKLI
ncbi:MAG: hypothetical protein J1E34_00295 [Oscillospiraceae bacterium]|nr:hypothetical protein [Oscillospiraceae bacterium]